MQQPKPISKELRCTKKANSRSLHTLGLHMCNILMKFCKWRTNQRLSEVKELVEVGVAQES